MCLIAFALNAHPKYRLILVANRDEFFERPTAPAGFWSSDPSILAGRDERAGGTWCGLTRSGRFASVTNYREPPVTSAEHLSRGELSVEFLRSGAHPLAHAQSLRDRQHRYGGFNLLLDDGREMIYLSNRGRGPEQVEPGVHGLSNHLLNSNWPKVQRSTEALKALLKNPDPDVDALLGVLLDDNIANDSELPDTGFGRAWERLLSPVFISTPEYGTRCSTVIMISHEGEILFQESTHEPGHPNVSSRRFAWSTGLEQPDAAGAVSR